MRHNKPAVPTRRFGSIDVGETLLLRVACRRLGWQREMQANVQRLGLRCVTIGRSKVTTGQWVREFVESMALRQAAGDQGQEGAGE